MEEASSIRPNGDSTGQRFGPYELVRRLGVGGMAETFEAVRRGPGGFTQRVCLKLVQPFFRDKEDFLQLFEREARLAAKLRHSNIVGVIDFGRIDGVTYMALELVDGIDLASLLDAQPGRRLAHEHVALVGHELARALEHAHDPRRDGAVNGAADTVIIHRDVSPSNVMVSQRGEVLLTDFGVAKAITGTARQQSAVKGKVPYMSPELLRAEPLDGRSDLFALGVVLFEALAGQRPFHGEHDPATIMMILKGERPPLGALAGPVPAGLVEVVESLLEPDRNKRPASATVLLERLDPFVPPPRMRRELGKMASESRAAEVARTSEPPSNGEKIADLQPERADRSSDLGREAGALVPTSNAHPSRSSGRSSRGNRKVIAWAFFAAVLIAGALALWPVDTGDEVIEAGDLATAKTAQSRTPPRTVDAREPSKEPWGEAPIETVNEADSASTRGKENGSGAPDTESTELGQRAEPAVPRAAPARLNVVVFPWGQVWINGKPRGSAPLQNLSLGAGRYKISAGQGAPSRTRTVRLREGERKTVEFDLTESIEPGSR